MNTDRAELAADDLPPIPEWSAYDIKSMRGTIDRYRSKKVELLCEQYFVCLHTFGPNARLTQHAFAMVANMHARMLKEGA